MTKNTLFVSEVFDNIDNLKTDDEKAAWLVKNHSKALETVLFYMFSNTVEFYRNSPPAYKPNTVPVDLGHATLDMALDRVYLFILGHPKTSPNLTSTKKDILLIQLLESMSWKEAEVFIRMITKKAPIGLNEQIVRKAYPKLLPGGNE